MTPYGIRIDEHDCGEFGVVQYAQWLNPDFFIDWEGCKRMWLFNELHVKALRRYISPGDTVIDIGAQVGYVMMPMMLATSPGGTVLAFEPNPEAFAVLKENARLNQHRSKIMVFDKAITEQEGRFTFHYTKSHTNGGFVTSGARGIGTAGCTEPLEVEGVELRSFLEREHITLERVSFIKIDTEGYDRKVLQSIGWLINQFRPVLRVEFFFDSSEAEKGELWEVLSSLGYKIFWEHHSDGRFTPEGLEVLSLEIFLAQPYIRDMLCFPKEKL